MKSLLFWIIVAQGADLTTTHLGLSRGCVEGWYPVHTAAGVTAMKGGSTLGFSLLYPIAKKKHPTVTRIVGWSLLASGAVGAIHNLNTLPNCRL